MPVALQGACRQTNGIVDVSCRQRIRQDHAPVIHAGLAVNTGGELNQSGIAVRRSDALTEYYPQ